MSDAREAKQAEQIDDLKEDHERYAGDFIPDPWDDPNQGDWPNEELHNDGVGTDARADDLA